MKKSFFRFNEGNTFIKRLISFSGILFFAWMISVFTISCEIGLGAAVDTMAPTLSIDYPPTNAIIRDTFVISGSCGDDDTVAEVQVSLRNIATNVDYGPYDADIEDNSSWSVRVNQSVSGGYNGWQIPDGSYTISVTVTDGVGRTTGPFTRTVDIDNTKPIFIVKTPTTDPTDANIKLFGTTLRISGTVAEKHSISSMKLVVDDKDSSQNVIQVPVELEQKNVDVSDGATVDFARFIKDNKNEASGPTKDYQEIYSEVLLDSGNTRILTDQEGNIVRAFKTSITISDNAKVYNGSSPSGANAEGNTTSVIYLSDDVYSTLFGTSGTNLGLSAEELIACVNGTSNSGTAREATVLNTLSTYAKDTTEDSNMLLFKLSPSARPVYAVSSLGQLNGNINPAASEGTYTEVMKGSQITALITGFDTNTFVNTASLKMWYYKLETDQYGINTIRSLVDNLQTAVYSGNPPPDGWRNIGNGSGNNAYQVTFNGSPDDVTGTKFYVVAVTGEDVMGTNLYYDHVYVFKGKSYSNPPTLELQSPEAEHYYTSTSGLSIEGIGESGGNDISKIKIQLNITNEDLPSSDPARTNSVPIEGTDTSHPSFATYEKVGGDPKKIHFKANFDSILTEVWKVAANSNKNLTYSLTVTVEDNSGKNTYSTLQIFVDSAKPALTIREPSPVVTTYEQNKKHINGTVSVVLNAEDKHLKEVKYQLLVNDTPAQIYKSDGNPAAASDGFVDNWMSLGSNSTNTITIDTTKYDDNKSLKIKLYAEDDAGNSIDETSQQYIVLQATDKPKITVRNATQTAGEIDPKNSNTIDGNNVFDTSKNSLDINLEDDDLLASVELKAWKMGANGVLSATAVTAPAAWTDTSTGQNGITSSRKYSFTPSLSSLAEGIYKVEITVKDSTWAGASSSYQANRTDTCEFWIVKDNAAPSFAENSTIFGGSENEVTIRENFTISGTASDTNALYSSTVSSTYPNATNKGKNAIVITARNMATNTTKSWNVDVGETTAGQWSKEIVVGASSSGDNKLDDGTYEFTIEVKDIAGKTTSVSRNAKIDTEKPVFKKSRSTAAANVEKCEITTEKTTVTESGTSTDWYKTGSLDLTGYGYDENGLESVKYVVYTGDYAEATGPAGVADSAWSEFSYNNTNQTWEGNVPSVVHQSSKIAVKLTDNAGNITYKSLGPVNIDTLPPVRGVDTLKVEYGTGTNKTIFVDEAAATPIVEQVISNKTKDIYVNVKLTDAAASGNSGSSGIDINNIYLNIGTAFSGTAKPAAANKISTATTAGTAIAYKLALANDGTASFTIPKAKADNGNVYLRFYDKAGNYTDEQLFTIVVDTSAPSARVSSPSASVLNGKNIVKGNTSDNSSTKKFALYYSTVAPTAAGAKLPSADDAEYGTSGTTSLVRIGNVLTSNINNWTYDSTTAGADRPIVDFNTISGAAYTAAGKVKDIYIIPVVYDEAGNCNVYTVNSSGTADYSYYTENTTYWKYTVNLDKDRPVIKITTLSADGETIKLNSEASIDGSITDDDSTVDAIVTHFIASSVAYGSTGFGATEVAAIISGKTTDAATGITTYTNTNISYTPAGGTARYDKTEFNAAGGEWTYYPADNRDGNKNVFFYIVDNSGNIFYTGRLDDSTGSTLATSDPVRMPKLRYKSTAENAATDNRTAVTYISDTQTPTTSITKLQWANVNTKTAAYVGTNRPSNYNGPDGETDTITSATKVGGPNKKYIRFETTAQDATGIKAMSLTLRANKTANGTTTQVTKTIKAGVTTGENADAGGSFTPTTDSTAATWKTGYIDVSGYDTGTLSVTLNAEDNSTLKKDSNCQITIDNTKPEVSNFVPTSTTEVTGSFEISGKSTDEGGSTLVKSSWMIPLKADSSKTDAQLAVLPEASSTDISTGGEALNGKWIPFSSASTWSTIFSENQAKAYDNTTTYNVTSEVSGGVTLYNIPFYVYAEDGNGNWTISKHTIKHNPDATIPRTSITYPALTDYDNNKNYITLGGPTRISGTATDNQSVVAVYLQIDHNAGASFNGTFDKNDAVWLSEGCKRDGSDTVLKQYEIYDLEDPANPVVITNFAGKADDFNWGIKVTGTTSWGYLINEKLELAPDRDSDTPNYIRLRTCAIDDEGHLSSWSEVRNVVMDNKAPIISNSAKLYKFSKPPVATISWVAATSSYSYSFADTSKPDSSQLYDKDMYVRNETNAYWYIAVPVQDENELSSSNPVRITRKIGTGSGIILSGVECAAANTTVASNSFYYVNNFYKNGDLPTKLTAKVLFIPVMNGVPDTATDVSYVISVTDGDNTQHTTTATFQFKIDNTAPAVNSLTDGNDDNLLGAEASPATDVPVIQNSNGIYNINARLTDADSGLKNMAFYISRTYGTGTSAVTKVFDVTKDNLANGETNTSKVAPEAVSTLQELTINSSYKLYGKKFTGGTYTETGSTYTYSATGISGDIHIRVGGLIYIDGMYRIITAISGNTVTFDTPASTGTTEAVFPYVHNIYADGSDNLSSSSFNTTDTTYSLNAQFNSHNIPDGPVTVHFFFFDNAGNITAKEVTTEIQNNAPRIARLFLGTDLNSDGKYGAGEFNEYLAGTIKLGTTNEVEHYVQDFELTTAQAKYQYGTKFKITKGLAVVPEYTGGNGSLKMVVLKDASTTTTYRTKAQATAAGGIEVAQANDNVVTNNFGTLLTNADDTTLGGTDRISKYVIENTDLPADGNNKSMSFTFWDETDGTTQSTDSNYFFVRVTDFDIDCVDDTGPKTVINPFYWASLKNNSIYGSGTAETFADLQGHIELEKDWNLSGNKTGTTGILDGDPKVSGKIVFTGTVYDEHTLKSIQMTVKNSAGTAITGWNNVELATYEPDVATNGGWTVPAKTLDDDGYTFTLKYDAADYPLDSEGEKLAGFGYYENNVYFSQRGHKVYWELELDTEKFAAQSDITLSISAKDQENNTTSSAANTTSGDETYNKPSYRMDIVPYITSVINSISAKKPLYARTTLGHYPVYTTRAQNTADSRETVIVNGFNLKAGDYVVFKKAKFNNNSYTNYHSYDASAKLAANGTNGFKFTVPADGISGEVVITSANPTIAEGAANANATITYSGVYTLNNLNNKNARGDYGYSTDENGVVTDELTIDDTTGEIGATGSYDDYLNFYNRCPNKKNNNLLTDDLYFDIWDFNTDAARTYDGRNSVLDLMMKIAPGQDKIGFAFCDGDEKWAMPGGTNNSYQSFVTTADFFKSTGFTYTSDGKTFGVCAGGESGTGYADTFSLYSSLSGANNGDKGSINGRNNTRIECISQTGTKTNANAGEQMDKDRFLSPAFAARSNGTGNTGSTDLYLAYLDNMNGEIRFRYGNIPNNSNTTATNHGQFRDSYNDVGWNGTTPKNYSHNTNYFQILATSEGDGLGYAGEYISMGVTSGGVVVIVWYDAKNGALKYSYNTSPTTARTGNATVGTGWQVVRDLSAHCGKFCQLVVDSEDHIHIAAYDTQKADLMYFYLDEYDSTSWTTSTVDSKDSAGEYLTLDVAEHDGNQIPYIGYWRASAQKPCLAYLANPSATDKAGTDTDFYTGTWECSIVPVQSTLPEQGEKNDQRNRINVAVWKTAGGSLTFSNKQNSSVTANGTGSGTCYGNGSPNPVLAYRITVGTSGRAETAQKK